MGLTREVVYLDSQQIDKLGEVKRRFGLTNRSEATRFLIDRVDPDILAEEKELAVWTALLQETVEKADASLDRAEQSLNETLQYFKELALERAENGKSFTGSEGHIQGGQPSALAR